MNTAPMFHPRFGDVLLGVLLATVSACMCPSTLCPLLGAELLVELPPSDTADGADEEYRGVFRATYDGVDAVFEATVTLRPDEDGNLSVAEVTRTNDDDAYTLGVEVRTFAGDESAPALYVMLSRTGEKEGIEAEFAPTSIDVTVTKNGATLHDVVLPVDAQAEEVRAEPGGASLCQYCEGATLALPLD